MIKQFGGQMQEGYDDISRTKTLKYINSVYGNVEHILSQQNNTTFTIIIIPLEKDFKMRHSHAPKAPETKHKKPA